MTAALLCLSMVVYYEARNEPLEGQVAVAQVVLNRVRDPRYPDTICEVVEQGPNSGKHRYRCQFSFWCDGLPEKPRNGRAWRHARVVAQLTHDGVLDAGIGDATHYHASYVSPAWSAGLTPVASIGRHNFYR